MRFLTGFIQKAQARGLAYTSFDAIKMFAIINMTADHIGYYFFPDDMWWRAIGRITFPVWFFLVGYSRSRLLGRTLWIYAILLVVDHVFLGRHIFPMNALVTIILCRILLNFCEDHRLLPNRLPEIMALCVIFSCFTMPLFEYGSVAFLYALFGRMVHQKQTRHFLALTLTCYLLFIAWQMIVFPFNFLQIIYVVLGTAWVVKWLSRCPNTIIWPNWTDSWWKTAITVLSRNTLPYYFYHRLLLEIIAAFLLGKGISFSLRFF